MRRSYVLLLLFLSCTASQKPTADEQQRYDDLFGTKSPPPNEDVDLTPGKKPADRGGVTSQPGKDPTPTSPSTPNKTGGGLTQAERERLATIFGLPNTTAALPADVTECETMAGHKGVCVYHYQCSPATGTVITDGTDILDMRLRECAHYLQVCCLLEQVQEKPPPPVVAPQACGWSNPGANAFRIINEEEGVADFGDFPWMVAVLKRSDGTAWSQNDFLGGGSIIHPSVVLTGAHKVDGKQAAEIKCRAGEWDTQTESEIYPHQERNVKKIVQHADYYRPSVYNSIALLILESPYELSSAPHMGVACVAPQPPPAGTRCYSMGWGKEFADKAKYAVKLKKVLLPTVSRDKCQKALRTTRLGVHFVLHPSLSCAGGEAGKDTCLGDGGSPLVCPIGNTDPNKEPSRFAIAGMVAWGIGCGDAVPGVYVNVPHFHDWLAQRMREEGFDTSSYTSSVK